MFGKRWRPIFGHPTPLSVTKSKISLNPYKGSYIICEVSLKSICSYGDLRLSPFARTSFALKVYKSHRGKVSHNYMAAAGYWRTSHE